MKRNMKAWFDEMIASPVKTALPVLSFPAIQLMDITVRELISDSDVQARGMQLCRPAHPVGGGGEPYGPVGRSRMLRLDHPRV